MNGWEFAATAVWALVWLWITICVAFVVILIFNHLYDLFKARIIKRYQTSVGWDEGYKQGVEDERKAAEWDIPEYRIPARQNPYGDPARYRGDSDAHEPLQAPR